MSFAKGEGARFFRKELPRRDICFSTEGGAGCTIRPEVGGANRGTAEETHVFSRCAFADRVGRPAAGEEEEAHLRMPTKGPLLRRGVGAHPPAPAVALRRLRVVGGLPPDAPFDARRPGSLPPRGVFSSVALWCLRRPVLGATSPRPRWRLLCLAARRPPSVWSGHSWRRCG